MSKRFIARPSYHRTRERVHSQRQLPAFNMWTKINGSYAAGPNLSPGKLETYKRVTADVVTPGFEQLIARGEIISNPYSSVVSWKTGGTSGPAGAVATDTGTVEYATDNGFRANLGSLATATTNKLRVDNLIRRVQTKALASVDSPTMEALVTLGEWRETVNLIRSPMKSLLEYFTKAGNRYHRELQKNALRQTWASKGKTLLSRRKRRHALLLRARGKERDAMKHINAFADGMSSAVLTYNLGWKPILMDLEALLEKIPKNQFSDRTTSRAQATEKWDGVTTSDHVGQWSTFSAEHTIHQEVSVRCSIIADSSFQTPSQHFGIRLADVPKSAWELIPLSFLFDYVVNVADYLSALRAQALARILAYSTTVEIKSSDEAVIVSESPTVCPWAPASGKPWSITGSLVGAGESAFLEAKTRFVDSFKPNVATDLRLLGEGRPPAQAQNVASLLTIQLRNISKAK